VIVRFVDIGGVADHHCLNFTFHKIFNMVQIKKIGNMSKKCKNVSIEYECPQI